MPVNILLLSSIHSLMPRIFFFFLKPELRSKKVTKSELVFFEFPKMVEAMYEQTPEFCMQFRKHSRYHVCLEELRVGKDLENEICCVLGLHSEESEYCDIEQKHYHLLLESSSKFRKPGKGYDVQCLYSTFSFLIHTTSCLKLNGDTNEEINRVLSYQESGQQEPIFKKHATNTQTSPHCEKQKITITFTNVLQILKSVHHRLAVLQGSNYRKQNEQCVYNEVHIISMWAVAVVFELVLDN